MIAVGDVVFVQNKGVCYVEDITKNAYEGADKTKEYYVLKPVESTNNMMIYFPTDTKITIRPIISKSKAIQLLNNLKSITEIEIGSEETRFETYNNITKTGEVEDRLKLLKTLLKRKANINKKQFNLQEQKYITSLTTCVVSELACALNVSKAEIESNIIEKISN